MQRIPYAKHLGLAFLLLVLGFLAMGVPSVIFTFWILLFWYSVSKNPPRYELMLLSVLGIFGGVLILPMGFWSEISSILLPLFALAALSPIAIFWIQKFLRK